MFICSSLSQRPLNIFLLSPNYFSCSKLTDISDRIKESKIQSMKSSLVDSIKMFHMRNKKLNQTRNNLIGMLPWHCNINKMLSSNNVIPFRNSSSSVLSFEEVEERIADTLEEKGMGRETMNGLVLGSGTVGHCVGSIDLPRDAVWCILITILLQTKNVDVCSLNVSTGSTSLFPAVNTLSDGSSPISIGKIPLNKNIFRDDFITLQLGSSMDSMRKIGSYFDRANAETGSVLYNIKHIIKGKCLAFRFDFSSLSSGKVCRLAVETGIGMSLIEIT